MGNQRFSVAPAKAAIDKDLPDTVYRTLAVLGIYGDTNGWCWPSTTTIAELRGMSRQAVSKHIRTLEERGYLNVQKRYKEDGGQTSNMYQIRFDYDAPPATPEVAPPATSEVALTPQENAPKESNDKPLTPQQLMVGVLADVTGLDYKIRTNAGRLAKRGKELLEAGYTPEQVETLYSPRGWWYVEDWRGQKDQKPKPEDILETIKTAMGDSRPIRVDKLTQKVMLPSGEVVEVEV